MEHTNPVLRFECECGDAIQEDLPELPPFDYSTEVHSDGVGNETYDVMCSECGREYKVDISNMFYQYDVVIPQHPNIVVNISIPPAPQEFDDYDYQEYLKSFVPQEPKRRYDVSLNNLDDMVNAAGELKTYPMFYRMVLLQHVAMMEAYLCDRLVTLLSVEEVLKNFVSNFEPLKTKQFPIVKLAHNPNLLTTETANFLKNQLYHELDQVDKMYNCALGASPFVSTNSKSFLKKVMINRHHCVHRDGKDNDGEVLRHVDQKYINLVRENIRLLVNNIEEKFANYIKKLEPKIEH